MTAARPGVTAMTASHPDAVTRQPAVRIMSPAPPSHIPRAAWPGPSPGAARGAPAELGTCAIPRTTKPMSRSDPANPAVRRQPHRPRSWVWPTWDRKPACTKIRARTIQTQRPERVGAVQRADGRSGPAPRSSWVLPVQPQSQIAGPGLQLESGRGARDQWELGTVSVRHDLQGRGEQAQPHRRTGHGGPRRVRPEPGQDQPGILAGVGRR